MTGDVMAEDPLCTHTPGNIRRTPPCSLGTGAACRPSRGVGEARRDRVRRRIAGDIAWDDAATERMKKIPAFVRGMVVRAVEDSCRKNGIGRVTVEELERIRARMPTPKMFR